MRLSSLNKAKIESSIVQKEEQIKQMTRDLERAETSPEIFNARDVESTTRDLRVMHAELASLKADLQKVNLGARKETVRAEFDGQVSIVNIAEGFCHGQHAPVQRTSKKFLEMRISDQTYGYVQVGDFAEFFVDAYPGHVFHAKVHNFTAGTGESSISTTARPTKCWSARRSKQQWFRSYGSARNLWTRRLQHSYRCRWRQRISAEKPHPFWGFIDVIGAATVRLQSYKSYLGAW